MPKILLAEDDFTMVSLLTTLLKMEGFHVVALDVEADVPSAVERENADILLMDVHLGNRNSVDMIDTIRNNPHGTNLKIVMTSGLNVGDECLRRGADHFILKPFMPDDLFKLLRE